MKRYEPRWVFWLFALMLAEVVGCSDADRTASPGQDGTGGGNARPSAAAEGPKMLEAGESTSSEALQENVMGNELAMFGGGCFWGVEEKFRQVEGVVATEVGYSGGTVENPTYQQVCTDTTGHAEVVRVAFDPSLVSYDQLLQVFWESHNPTQLDRQGPDVGKQYRSAIFFYSPEQEKAARGSKEELEKSGRYNKEIVTAIEPAGRFYRAEEYHQQYLAKRGRTTCATTIKD